MTVWETHYHGAYVILRVGGQHLGVSTFIAQVPAIELRLSVLVANTFNLWAILSTHEEI